MLVNVLLVSFSNIKNLPTSTMTLASTALAVAEYAQGMGPVGGPVFFTLVLSAWVVACLPCTIVEIIPGFLFGIEVGWVVSMLGKSIGSAIAMYLGRYVFKDATQQVLFKRYPILRKLGIAAEREGFPFLLFVRGMWLPIALKNYGLAVLNVSILQVLWAGFLTSIPHSLLWAWIGSKMNNLAEIAQSNGKIKVTDFLPGWELAMIGTPVVLAGLYIGRNFYLRFNSILLQED